MNQLQQEQDPAHCHRSILPHHNQERWQHNCSRMLQTQFYTKKLENNWIMDNWESIQGFKKHGTNILSNEMGRLCQGVVTETNGIRKRVEGTNTFHVIKFEDIPKYRLNEIWYTSVVCEVRPGKKDPNWTRITICGTNVCYSGDVGTNITSQEIFKLMINSILSRAGAKYVCFEIYIFYLSTLLVRPEYVKIQLWKILQEFIKEYNLNSSVHKGWVYFEIICGCYGIPQSGILANKHLRLRLE